MKNIVNRFNIHKIVPAIAILFLFSLHTFSQQIKPATSGYPPVNGIRMYYEVYGEGKPIILLHGAFYTFEMNWVQLIPELSKKEKICSSTISNYYLKKSKTK